MIFKVKVKPNSSRQEIEEKNDVLYASLEETAEQNRANMELINLLAKYYHVSASQIKILRGKTSRSKIVEVKFDT